MPLQMNPRCVGSCRDADFRLALQQHCAFRRQRIVGGFVDAAAMIRFRPSLLACTGLSSVVRDPVIAAGGLTIVALDGDVYYNQYIPPRAKLLRAGAMARVPLLASEMRSLMLAGIPSLSPVPSPSRN